MTQCDINDTLREYLYSIDEAMYTRVFAKVSVALLRRVNDTTSAWSVDLNSVVEPFEDA